MGNTLSSISFCPGMDSTIAQSEIVHQPYWRGHSYFAFGVDTTRGVTVTGYKPLLDWRRAWRQGLFPSVGGIFGSHWTATARLKLGSPQPIRCCPATAASLIGCMGDRRNLNGRLRT